MTDLNVEITATVRRETAKLAAFIKRRVRDVGEAEDILQDVFHEFVQACRLPEPIEQASSWLFRVASNRIIDFYRKAKVRPTSERITTLDDDDAGGAISIPAGSPMRGQEPRRESSMSRAAIECKQPPGIIVSGSKARIRRNTVRVVGPA